MQSVKRKIASEFKFKYADPVQPRMKIIDEQVCSKGGNQSCLHSFARAKTLALKFGTKPLDSGSFQNSDPQQPDDHATTFQLTKNSPEVLQYLETSLIKQSDINDNKKVRSPVYMDNKRQRVLMFDDIKGPNENRFLNLNLMPTTVVSKYSNVEPPDFKRYAIRDMHKVQNSNPQQCKNPMPDYNPNTEFTKKSLSLGMTPFEKQMDRKGIYESENQSRNNDYQPSIYSYADSNLKGYLQLSNAKKADSTFDFNKIKARDNSMYLISDGYNLEPKEETFIDRLIELNAVPLNSGRRLSNLVRDAISNYGGNYDLSKQSGTPDRSMERDHYEQLDKINKLFRITKNNHRSKNNKSTISKHSKDMTLTESDVRGFTLEQKLLSGYYKTESLNTKNVTNSKPSIAY